MPFLPGSILLGKQPRPLQSDREIIALEGVSPPGNWTGTTFLGLEMPPWVSGKRALDPRPRDLSISFSPSSETDKRITDVSSQKSVCRKHSHDHPVLQTEEVRPRERVTCLRSRSCMLVPVHTHRERL